MDDPTQAAETAEDTQIDAAAGAVQEAPAEAEALPVVAEADAAQAPAPAGEDPPLEPAAPSVDAHTDPADGEISTAATDTDTGGDPAFAPASLEADDDDAADAEGDEDLPDGVTLIDPDLAALNAGLARMFHRDGNGACDRFEMDDDGFVLVPLSEIAGMRDHGFEVSYGEGE